MHADLSLAQQFLYQPKQLAIKNLALEQESRAYAACSFNLPVLRNLYFVLFLPHTLINQ